MLHAYNADLQFSISISAMDAVKMFTQPTMETYMRLCSPEAPMSCLSLTYFGSW